MKINKEQKGLLIMTLTVSVAYFAALIYFLYIN